MKGVGLFLVPQCGMLVHPRFRHPAFILYYPFHTLVETGNVITRQIDSGPVDIECSTQAISSQCPNLKYVNGQKKVYPRYCFPTNIHQNLLYSDWLGAVQFKCNIGAKTVSPMQNDTS